MSAAAAVAVAARACGLRPPAGDGSSPRPPAASNLGKGNDGIGAHSSNEPQRSREHGIGRGNPNPGARNPEWVVGGPWILLPAPGHPRASASSSAMCSGLAAVRCRIWWRQLVPEATTLVPSGSASIAATSGAATARDSSALLLEHAEGAGHAAAAGVEQLGGRSRNPPRQPRQQPGVAERLGVAVAVNHRPHAVSPKREGSAGSATSSSTSELLEAARSARRPRLRRQSGAGGTRRRTSSSTTARGRRSAPRDAAVGAAPMLCSPSRRASSSRPRLKAGRPQHRRSVASTTSNPGRLEHRRPPPDRSRARGSAPRCRPTG